MRVLYDSLHLIAELFYSLNYQVLIDFLLSVDSPNIGYSGVLRRQHAAMDGRILHFTISATSRWLRRWCWHWNLRSSHYNRTQRSQAWLSARKRRCAWILLCMPKNMTKSLLYVQVLFAAWDTFSGIPFKVCRNNLDPIDIYRSWTTIWQRELSVDYSVLLNVL